MHKLSKNRQEAVKKRKNFFPALIITIILWMLLGGFIYFVDPQSFGSIQIFFILLFFGLLFTFSTIFANTRRGLLTSIGLTFFLILRFFGVGNVLNFLLIGGVLIAADIFFTRR